MGSIFFGRIISLAFLGSLLLTSQIAEAQTRPIPRIPRNSLPASSLPNTVGQIDPAEPIDIVVTNGLTGALRLGFSGGPNVELDPGEAVVVSFPIVPVNLFLYPAGQEISTQQNIMIDENTIMVEVVETEDVAPGDGSINIDRAGHVYIF